MLDPDKVQKEIQWTDIVPFARSCNQYFSFFLTEIEQNIQFYGFLLRENHINIRIGNSSRIQSEKQRDVTN